MWFEQTYWIEVDLDERKVLQALTLDDFVRGLLPAAFPAKDYPPCSACFSHTACMDSIWEDGGRMGGPTEAIASSVFTCKTCQTPRFQISAGGAPVADDCPRLALNKEARDCHICRTKRSSLRLVRG